MQIRIRENIERHVDIEVSCGGGVVVWWCGGGMVCGVWYGVWCVVCGVARGGVHM